MPAPKITRDDVAEAIRILNHQGIPDPGVHRLRTFLGRGSVTTVARFKNELHQIELEKIAPKDKKPLPDPVSALAKQLWDELLAAVESVEQDLMTKTERCIADRQRQLDLAEAERDQALAQTSMLTEELTTTRERSEHQREQLHALETIANESKARLGAHETLIKTLNVREQDLKRVMAEMARQAAMREKILNDQLSQERSRSYEAQQYAEHQRQELEAQLLTLRENLISQREQAERTVALLQATVHYLEETLTARNQDQNDLRAEHLALRTQHEQLGKHTVQIEKALVRTQAELDSKDQMIELMASRRNELQALHQEAKANYEQTILQLKKRIAKTRQNQ